MKALVNAGEVFNASLRAGAEGAGRRPLRRGHEVSNTCYEPCSRVVEPSRWVAGRFKTEGGG
jgi:hypothetical protein